MTSKKNKLGEFINSISASIEHYLDCVGREALSRAGNNQNLKGHIHEIMFRDKLNLGIKNILAGKVAKLTKNPSARGVDVVQTQSAKVVGKYQLKDSVSDSGVNKILNQTRNGKYRNAKLMGTKETTAKHSTKARLGDKQMESTGVSSNRTGRVADNISSKQNGKSTWNNVKDIGSCAKTSALIGAGLGAASSVISNGQKFRNGEINGTEYAKRVACDSVKSGARSGATTLGALALKEGGKAVAKRMGSETLRRVMGGNAATAAAFGLVEIGMDAMKLANGKITGKKFIQNTCATAGGAAGGYGGALGGAMIGTLIFPGIGTAIGGLIGAMGGGIGARSLVGTIAGRFG
mgnify:CR=1 FL=1